MKNDKHPKNNVKENKSGFPERIERIVYNKKIIEETPIAIFENRPSASKIPQTKALIPIEIENKVPEKLNMPVKIKIEAKPVLKGTNCFCILPLELISDLKIKLNKDIEFVLSSLCSTRCRKNLFLFC